jgi:hypothetical protein
MNLLNNAILRVPTPVNEPINSYAPGTPERDLLKAALADIAAKKVEIPLIIGGQEVRTGKTGKVVMPHDHQHVLGEYHIAGEQEINMAIDAAMAAKSDWAALRWEERAAIFLKAAELLAGKRTAEAGNDLLQVAGQAGFVEVLDRGIHGQSLPAGDRIPARRRVQVQLDHEAQPPFFLSLGNPLELISTSCARPAPRSDRTRRGRCPRGLSGARGAGR